MRLGHTVATGEELQNVVLVFRHGTGALEVDELAEWVAASRRAEALVHQFNKLGPGGHALVAFQTIVPHSCGTLHVEGRQPNALVIGRARRVEVLLTAVEPGDRVLRAVEGGKSVSGG
uniref:Uncharacterized protein n=1 Tax=Arundo donax TaxID=35708 RepID=A0A0A8ZDW5_ARUDO